MSAAVSMVTITKRWWSASKFDLTSRPHNSGLVCCGWMFFTWWTYFFTVDLSFSFPDLSKTLFRVWHKGLLYQLKFNGING